jgi:hypothetical protein
MQHRKVKGWPSKFTGFWVEAPFLEAKKEDSKMFFWSKCEVKVLPAKKHTFAHSQRQRTSFCNLSKVVYNLFSSQHILIFKQFLSRQQMCRCFVCDVWRMQQQQSYIGFTNSNVMSAL